MGIARETREGTRTGRSGEDMGLGRSLALPGGPEVPATAPSGWAGGIWGRSGDRRAEVSARFGRLRWRPPTGAARGHCALATAKILRRRPPANFKTSP